ncbi:MAG: glutamate--tRNA ligase [Polyangiaceae bacterium]|nr:glutamate--tRNA ligase [Polyangiaceae bacterium]
MPPSSDVRVRFAPSPTGYLHIGGVRTALFNWLWARKNGGVFVLRIEDTDQERSTPESRQVILDSMRWLGLTWDEGPEKGGDYGPYTQMERLDLYKKHADELIEQGKAYRCYATKEELDAAREELKKKDPKANFRYPGWWRDKGPNDWLPGKPYVVRFKVPKDGAVTYVDKVFGEVTTPNAAQQDFVLVRSDGIPLYNFGCVIDDMTMRISLVARGRDHMVNTPPQILLYEAFGKAPPDFAHLPMMLAPSGEKLSKRHGAVSVTEYRDNGYHPNGLLNYLVRFGWSHGDQEVFSLQGLIDAFNWEACGKGDGKFDPKKFLAIQHEHMKQAELCPDREYASRTKPFLDKRGLAIEPASIERAVYSVRERSKTFVESAEGLDFLFRDPPEFDAKSVEKFLVADNAARLRELREVYAGVTDWKEDALDHATHRYLEEKAIHIKDVAQPARVALTGRTVSPGLYQVLYLLGRERSLARFDAAIKMCETAVAATKAAP